MKVCGIIPRLRYCMSWRRSTKKTVYWLTEQQQQQPPLSQHGTARLPAHALSKSIVSPPINQQHNMITDARAQVKACCNYTQSKDTLLKRGLRRIRPYTQRPPPPSFSGLLLLLGIELNGVRRATSLQMSFAEFTSGFFPRQWKSQYHCSLGKVK